MLNMHEKFNNFMCIFASAFRAMCIDVYMRINTHSSLEIFSKGKFYYYYYYYYFKKLSINDLI